MTTKTWNFAKEQAIREIANMQVNGRDLSKDGLLSNMKTSVDWHEKKTVDGSNFQQGSYLFETTISHRKDDVK